DKLLKYWDGDKERACITPVREYSKTERASWRDVISNSGKFVVTGSHDKLIRVWEKTDELLFLEEEQEKELEAIYEKGIADMLSRSDAPIGSGVADAEAEEANLIDVADHERGTFRAYYEERAASRNPESLPPCAARYSGHAGSKSGAYVFRKVEKVRSTGLFDALLVLPFGKVVSLLVYLNEWALREWNTVLVSRIMFFLLKTHHHQIATNRTMRAVLIRLRTRLRGAIRRQKEEIGYNIAGQFIKRNHEAKTAADIYAKVQEDEAKVWEKIVGLEKK
ncbi:hypothetical protein BS47DRAFT_1361977, partial [Hydnum rufescens UP504]